MKAIVENVALTTNLEKIQRICMYFKRNQFIKK